MISIAFCKAASSALSDTMTSTMTARPPSFKHSIHLGHDFRRFGEVMDRKAGDNTVERRIGKRHRLRVAFPKFDIPKSGLFAARTGFLQHGRRRIEGGDPRGVLCQGRGHDAGSARDIQQDAFARVADGTLKPRFDFLVRFDGMNRKRIGLACKLFFDAVQIVHVRSYPKENPS